MPGLPRILFAAVLGVSTLAASDLTGKWSGAPFYVVFEQKGEQVTGTAGTSDRDQFPIENARLEGDHLTFQVGPYPFDLHVKGDEIRGELQDRDQKMNVYLKRLKPRSGVSAALAFDAASVKPSQPASRGSSMRLDTGRLRCGNVTLLSLITRAYDLKNYQVSAPEWMSSEMYDIVATLPPGSTTGEVLDMLQNLLTERFRLEVHKETRELAVYGLTVGKNGPKMKEVAWGFGNTSGSRGRVTARSIDMSALAGFLTQQVDRPVVDMTGLKAHYDFTMEWTPEGSQPPKLASDGGAALAGSALAEPLGPSIYNAVQEQLGLKLEARKAPIEILVVDRAEKVPVGN